MKDFSYLVNHRKIKDIDEVKNRLVSGYFHKEYFPGEKYTIFQKKTRWDVLRIMKGVSTFFRNNNGYFDFCSEVFDCKKQHVYGFILVGNNSIPSYFDASFSKLKGLSIIGYGFDERVIDQFWIEKMLHHIWFSMELYRGFEDETYNLNYDYIWVDCPRDKITYYRDKYEMKSFENLPNILYKFINK